MSICRCDNPRKRKSVAPGQIAWFWRCLARSSEMSEGGAFEKPSRFCKTNVVVCLRCLTQWRTTARYADQLREPSAKELAQVQAGQRQDGHVASPLPEEFTARRVAREQQVDYKMRAAGEA